MGSERRPGAPTQSRGCAPASASFAIAACAEPLIDTLRNDWTALESRLGARRGPEHTLDWNLAAHAAFGRGEDWRIVTGSEPDRSPQVGCVLRRVSRRIGGIPFRVLETPINPYLPLTDIAIAPDAGDIAGALRRALSRWPARWSALVIRRVPAGSAFLHGLGERIPAGWIVVRDEEPCFVLKARAREQNRDLLSKKFRANLRNANNKLAALPAVRFEAIRDADALPQAFEAFLRVEASGWKGQADSAVRAVPAALRFYAELMTRFGRKRECEINLLWSGETCIGGQFALVVEGTTYLLKIGYDESYAAAAPGHLMIEWLLNRCSIEAGRGDVCLTSNPGWLRSWQPDSLGRSAVYILNRTITGVAARVTLKMRELRERWRSSTRVSRVGELTESNHEE